MSKVLDFISVFDSPSNRLLFTENACYWFASILHQRFSESTIMYDPHQVHFATKIRDKVYDITGIVDSSDYVEWEEYKAHSDDAYLIIECCIELERR